MWPFPPDLSRSSLRKSAEADFEYILETFGEEFGTAELHLSHFWRHLAHTPFSARLPQELLGGGTPYMILAGSAEHLEGALLRKEAFSHPF